jgi:glycosyltransferase involved in cell wall biosynthesis
MRLIYVGLVIPRKGLLPLIEALAQVRTQNWRLDVVGSLKMDRRLCKPVPEVERPIRLGAAYPFSGRDRGHRPDGN